MDAKTKVKPRITFKGLQVQGALQGFLKPKLAKDAQIDYMQLIGGITNKNFKDKKKELVASVAKLTKGKLAKDANIEGLVQLIDALEGEPANPMEEMGGGIPGREEEGTTDAGANVLVAGPEKKEGLAPETDKEEQIGEAHDDEYDAPLAAFLRERGLDDADVQQACKLAEHGAPSGLDEKEDEDAEDEMLDGKVTEKGKEISTDEPSSFKGMPEPGGKMAGDVKVKKAAMDAAITKVKADGKKAMDEAIAKLKTENETRVKQAADAALKNARETRDAENEVRPWVGHLTQHHDNAEAVYRTALTMLGMDKKLTDEIKEVPALRLILKSQPKAGTQRDREKITMAADASVGADFAKRNPMAARIESTL